MDDYKSHKEETDYNEDLDLETEIMTDQEGKDACGCGSGSECMTLELQRRRCKQTWHRYRKDHYKFNDMVKSPRKARGPDTLSKFTCLPPEIRDKIYRYVFQAASWAADLRQWKPAYECPDVDPEHHDEYIYLKPLDTRKLAVNRQIYAEALDIPYSSNDFVVDVSEGDTIAQFVHDATGLAAPRPTSKIRRWHILVTLMHVKQELGKAMHTIASAMKQCLRLDEVRFTWITVPRE